MTIDYRKRRAETCHHCKVEVCAKLVRDIAANGAINCYWLCVSCNKPFYRCKQFIPHEKIKSVGIDIEDLPIVEDYSADGEPCVVCHRRGTEYHHWAPKHLFSDDAENWPGAYLCRNHHTMWHQLVTPNMTEARHDK